MVNRILNDDTVDVDDDVGNDVDGFYWWAAAAAALEWHTYMNAAVPYVVWTNIKTKI